MFVGHVCRVVKDFEKDGGTKEPSFWGMWEMLAQNLQIPTSFFHIPACFCLIMQDYEW